MPSKKVSMKASLVNRTSVHGIMGGLYNRKISGRSSNNRTTSRLIIPRGAAAGLAYMQTHNLLSRNPLGSGGVGRMFRLQAGGCCLGNHLGSVKTATENLGDSENPTTVDVEEGTFPCKKDENCAPPNIPPSCHAGKNGCVCVGGSCKATPTVCVGGLAGGTFDCDIDIPGDACEDGGGVCLIAPYSNTITPYSGYCASIDPNTKSKDIICTTTTKCSAQDGCSTAGSGGSVCVSSQNSQCSATPSPTTAPYCHGEVKSFGDPMQNEKGWFCCSGGNFDETIPTCAGGNENMICISNCGVWPVNTAANTMCTGTPNMFCGSSWTDADARCHAPCPNGLDSECKAYAGETCYKNLPRCNAPTPAKTFSCDGATGQCQPDPHGTQGAAACIASCTVTATKFSCDGPTATCVRAVKGTQTAAQCAATCSRNSGYKAHLITQPQIDCSASDKFISGLPGKTRPEKLNKASLWAIALCAKKYEDTWKDPFSTEGLAYEHMIKGAYAYILGAGTVSSDSDPVECTTGGDDEVFSFPSAEPTEGLVYYYNCDFWDHVNGRPSTIAPTQAPNGGVLPALPACTWNADPSHNGGQNFGAPCFLPKAGFCENGGTSAYPMCEFANTSEKPTYSYAHAWGDPSHNYMVGQTGGICITNQKNDGCTGTFEMTPSQTYGITVEHANALYGPSAAKTTQINACKE